MKKKSDLFPNSNGVEKGQNWLNLDLYKHKKTYPTKPVRPKDPLNSNDPWVYRSYADCLDTYNLAMKEYDKLVDEYNDEEYQLYTDFRGDALDAVGLTDHPAMERAFAYAWDQGHAYGNSEVWLKLQQIAEVILGPNR